MSGLGSKTRYCLGLHGVFRLYAAYLIFHICSLTVENFGRFLKKLISYIYQCLIKD